MVTLVLAAWGVAGPAPDADAHVDARAYVTCGFEPSPALHWCQIGDAPHAWFRDGAHRSRRYKVCVRGPGTRFRFCILARQRGGRPSAVNLLRFQEAVGTYTVRWFVPGRSTPVRVWRFYFAIGD